jgi:S-adenosyl-L-methionine hydrolase (adenosine-forming)
MQWISFITDFGLKDPYLGQLKGSLLSKRPDLGFIDISHFIKTHDIVSAGWLLKNTYQDMPPGSIQLVSVLNNYANLGSLIVFQYDQYTFVGPNNGIFSLAFEKLPADIYEVKLPGPFSIKKSLVHCIEHLTSGKAMHDIWPPVKNLIVRIQLQPVINKFMIRGSVIYIDQYENVILNITRQQFEQARANREFSIWIKRNDPIQNISESYQSVSVGESLCLFNSFDHMEIAIHGGPAASILGLAVDEMIQIDFI